MVFVHFLRIYNNILLIGQRKEITIESRIINQNMKNAVILLLKSRHIKNPESLTQNTINSFTHTNSRGISHTYYVFNSYCEYKRFSCNVKHKLYRLNSFYIIELL